ncbi:DUF2147 domain-containing protein [Parablastomonas sp. CN1-191]|uniref:DUF2147 domain-containing protein n=1 Tax=Parablastomonas sp. CN1-191 TaxID=3400908 RepID=UPI003BF7B9CC
MSRFARFPLCLAAALALAATGQPAYASPPPGIDGMIWINPFNSVKVRTEQCGESLCGRVVWATPGAEEEAREGGTARLVGTELLQDYRPSGPGRWSGHVFVPDMGHRFSSTLELQGGGKLKVSGCILAGLVCKSQIWRRA